MHDKRTSGVWMAVVLMVVALLLPALYAGSYLSLLDPHGVFSVSSTQGLPAHYRIGGDYSRWVFHPIHLLDRQLRPTRWNPLRASICIDFIETGFSPEWEVWVNEQRPANDGVPDRLSTSGEFDGDIVGGKPLSQ